MRGSDAVGLRWEEIDWEAHEINRLTLKRRKRVVLPIHQELLFALEIERDKRKPQPEDRVLVNPETGRPLTRPRLYERMLALGRRAGVPGAHPHRFRHTFAVDLLSRGASPYDVAKLLGDTVDTIEKHYAEWVKELRERARRIMESGEGLEITGTQRAHQTTEPKRFNENKKISSERAYKPDSVQRIARNQRPESRCSRTHALGDHSSGPPIARRLKRPTRGS